MCCRAYRKLWRRLEDYDYTIPLLAEKLGVCMETMRTRFSGKSDWRKSEVLAICQLAEIKQEEIGEYFYPELSA